ncbi:SnoaL-like domain-containing protein [Flavobacterium sp.]|uniref:SnoaL-like domain-containing protein n=1 Tax=Flavobacterium sp. TaxID=239 RepID=UPI00286AB94C|nr:SnoaL-like domain-containing protein [Flavobacterium sp.]
MTEHEITTALDELIGLVAEGQALQAYEKFYHEDIQKIDLDGTLQQGKETLLKNGVEALSIITDVRDFSAVGKIVKGNRSFLVWSIDLDNTNGTLKVVEVAVQDWKDGKIISERFFA